MTIPAVKFCGLTRAEDAAAAAEAGASYLGIIFAGGPRQLTRERAAEVLTGAASARASRVGVFGSGSLAEIARTADHLELDVVQLHADPTPSEVESLRGVFAGHIWAALRVRSDRLPADAAALFDIADGIVLDAHVGNRDVLGGTGVALAWGAIREELAELRVRGRARVVLAGGLTAANVERAIMTLSPDVVDVSSGVERAPGIKDHVQLHAFGEAVRRSIGLPSAT
jgi:phosphoribosylanthranilate isomerase